MSQDADPIRAQQQRIADQIAKLQKEHDELAVALRVLDRFNKPGEKAQKSKPKQPAKKVLPPRPDGIPSTFDMVDKILAAAEAAGKPALTSRELMDEIRAKYWPGVTNGQILPSIFGFAPKRITREGDKWKRKARSLFA